MHHCAELIFKVDYLHESVFQTVLTHESVDPGVLFDEKTRGWKSRATVPLKYTTLLLASFKNEEYSHRYLKTRLSLQVIYLWRHVLSTAPPFIL
jgi:hypothetical protein